MTTLQTPFLVMLVPDWVDRAACFVVAVGITLTTQIRVDHVGKWLIVPGLAFYVAGIVSALALAYVALGHLS